MDDELEIGPAETTTQATPPPKSGFFKSRRFALAALVLIAVVGAVGFQFLNQTPAPKATTMPSNPAIEERWGIRISQVGVTADGGMVDFRFVVLDPDKAQNMMQDENNLPVLISEDKNRLVNSAALMSAKHGLNPGVTYFLLYRNTGGAIKHGGNVSVVFGDIKLEHVPVK